MLSKQDNDTMCQVGPGTPMGDLCRLFWIPGMTSDELPSPDCPPLRIRLLGENLIAFRTTSGAVGVIQNACPHRGASMFFGRNEEEGLRCVYHGWKFDVAGNCVDMPSEPAESNFKNKVRTVAYEARERGGVIWVYMGPKKGADIPGLPDIETNMSPAGTNTVTKAVRECNFVQALEGDIDTSHISFLHRSLVDDEFAATPDEFNKYVGKQSAPWYAVSEMDYGTIYGAYRPAEDDSYYWRIGQFVLPFYAMPGDRPSGLRRPPRLPRLGANRRQQHDVLHDGGPSRHRPCRPDPRRRRPGQPHELSAQHQRLERPLAPRGQRE